MPEDFDNYESDDEPDFDDDGVCPDCHAAVDEECDEDCPSWEEE